ncbi:MAG: F0F1 ATP synthase subunit gamma [Dongiaceae bacterium]
MPSLKDLRGRIKSVKSTRKITSAMKMVAAAKLRRTQEQALAGRPYAQKMGEILARLSAAIGASATAPKLLHGTGFDKTHLLIVATSDRGLCGAFNSSIVRRARVEIRRLLTEGKIVKILCVGRKGRDQLRRDYGQLIVGTIDEVGKKKLGFNDAQSIAARVLEMFEKAEFDVATIIYNTFKSAISQIVTVQQLIPAAAPSANDNAEGSLAGVYEFEPEAEEILASLLPLNIGVQIYRGLLENAASEQAARMVAMDNATRNAGQVIDRLTLNYNRARQAYITREMIEIVSGAEAV